MSTDSKHNLLVLESVLANIKFYNNGEENKLKKNKDMVYSLYLKV